MITNITKTNIRRKVNISKSVKIRFLSKNKKFHKVPIMINKWVRKFIPSLIHIITTHKAAIEKAQALQTPKFRIS